MTQNNGHEPLSEDRRKEIFLALVDAQDHEMDVTQSRRLVVQHFGVTEGQVRQIEREGMDRQWPPCEQRAADVSHDSLGRPDSTSTFPIGSPVPP
jgi:hypothetical protein